MWINQLAIKVLFRNRAGIIPLLREKYSLDLNSFEMLYVCQPTITLPYTVQQLTWAWSRMSSKSGRRYNQEAGIVVKLYRLPQALSEGFVTIPAASHMVTP